MNNKEYEYWRQVFSRREFKNYLDKLKNICKGRQVVVYSNGIYFEALSDTYDLNNYFDILGVSDIRYENSSDKFYKRFSCIKPSELNTIAHDVILITTPNPSNILKFLKDVSAEKIPVYIDSPPDYSLIRKRYKKIISKLKQKNKIRLLFVCEEPAKWSYTELYKKFSSDNRFDVLPVLLQPIITANREEFNLKENAEFFSRLGIQTLDGSKNKNIRDFAPDIVFYEQPWYLTGDNHPTSVSKYALTVMVPYGYTTLNTEDWGSNLVKQVHLSLWKFFSESPYHNSFYKKTIGEGMDSVLEAVGSLKLDNYRVPPKQNNYWKGGGKRIIWAPHHTINDDGLRMGTFKQNYKFFLDFASKNPQYSFLLKPHPALKNTCIKSGLDYDLFIKEWNSLPNTSVYTEGEYFDIFKTSDLLITDCSSFLAEYFPTGKPIILLSREDRAPFDEFGEKLRKGFYEANTNEELENCIKEVLEKNNDRLKATREAIIKKDIYLPQKSACDNIYEFIKKAISQDT